MKIILANQTSNAARFTENVVMLVTILGTGMVYLDQTAINVALSAMQQALTGQITSKQMMEQLEGLFAQ